MLKQIIIGAALAGALVPVWAAPAVAEQGAVFTLAGEASTTLVNDEAILTFTVERQKPDAQSATREVVRAANAALAALKPFASVSSVETTDFSTWPVYRKAKEGETSTVGAWGVRQTIRVKVSDVKVVSDVMQAAGRTMDYDGIAFGVSKKTRKAADDKLLAEAIKDASSRAVIAAEALGLGEANVKIEGLTLGQSNAPSVRYYAAPRAANDAMMKSAVAPAVSAGTSEVTLRISMQVRIAP